MCCIARAYLEPVEVVETETFVALHDLAHLFFSGVCNFAHLCEVQGVLAGESSGLKIRLQLHLYTRQFSQ